MQKDTLRLLKTVVLLTAISVAPAPGHATELALDFAGTGSVAVTKVRAARSDHELQLVGQVCRPHRLPMTGHLHAYVYGSDGDLVADSQHRIAGLNSRRGGSLRLPFRISLKEGADEADRVFLEYHGPGRPET